MAKKNPNIYVGMRSPVGGLLSKNFHSAVCVHSRALIGSFPSSLAHYAYGHGGIN